MADHRVRVYSGEQLARYAFGENHPFGPLRQDAFLDEFRRRGLERRTDHGEPVGATETELLRFHRRSYLDQLRAASLSGRGYLDAGDTPAFVGVYEAAASVAGTMLAALHAIMAGQCRRAFVPIAGLHHARRDAAAGFCVVNDCGIVIETLLHEYGITRLAYVDIDAHHGDGVFYSFEADPRVVIADIHQDGHTLYPGSGDSSETGSGAAHGTKLNLPLPPGATDSDFMQAWEQLESFIASMQPGFILLQCGADSLRGDPLTQLALSARAHGHAARRLARLAERHCGGRLLAAGGGGYNLDNLAHAWCAVVEGLL